ncbi:METTL5 family protein [Haloarchaeobius sp. HME9146]|uniref:METTL5 family protein n=1 Tax=Haloarchaeobius sp. HME9146 TaxID=2978732 RepID=UPI0021BF4140|nr:METTL5 family protein [Haloarchaeobius sp. HME9146]MCT9096516.1 METTL5 family protein [Haloarchaeobius sp. HME9146]
MSTRRALAQQLGVVAGFDSPSVELEQYPTPPEVAASLVHVADMEDDVADRTVVDLGTGTGMLALGAALRGARRVVGVDLDRDALGTARENERRVGAHTDIHWVAGDATRPPLCPDSNDDVTVVMNPPFGAQRGNEHADRAFLDAAGEVATVSYSIHNAGSREFVESFAGDHGGEVTHAFAVELDLDRQFPFHEEETKPIDAEAFRIDWTSEN